MVNKMSYDIGIVLEEDWGVSGEYYPPADKYGWRNDSTDPKEKEQVEKEKRSFWDKFWEN